MEDDHVDRPGVEERQRLKLTGTNSSIGLIVLITYIHQGTIRRIVAILTHACSALRAALRGCGATAPTVGRPCEASLRRVPGRMNIQGTTKTSEQLGKQQIGSPIGYSLSAIRFKKLLDLNMRFADLVVMAERLHPIPFRTRP